jgi:putative ABC transport system permease protein
MKAWVRRVFSVALLVYPRDFRDDYRASMTDHFTADDGGTAQALRTIGDVFATSISMRLENLWRDITYAVRMNMKAPLFTIVVIGAIALSIATNTVVFALLNAVLLKPLPYPDAGRLALIWDRAPQAGGQTFTTLSNGQLDAVARFTKTFASVTGAMSTDSVKSDDGTALSREEVMPNYFATLGIKPVLGVLSIAGNGSRDAVISASLWRRRFANDPHVLGAALHLDGVRYTIVGVAPESMLDPSFNSLSKDDVWTGMPKAPPGTDAQFPVFPIARLRAGVTWQQAQADITRVQHVAKGSGAPLPGSSYYTQPLDASILSSARSFLWMVFAAVTGVLLIACANVANLLLVRRAARAPEFSIRSAVGASGRRIAGQVFTETLLLAVTGAAIGLLAAWLALPWARTHIPGNFPRLASAGVDGPVLGYVCALVLGVTFVAGMLPTSRLRPVLIAVEVAIAFAMAVAFGLMLRSFVSMTGVDIGFAPGGLYVANVHPSRTTVFSIDVNAGQRESALKVVREVQAIPGVRGASLTTNAPFSNLFNMMFTFNKGWNGKGGLPIMMNATQVDASYFKVMHIPLVAGRLFQSADTTTKTPNVIVNQALARKYFPHGNAVGKTLGPPSERWRIIGVVGDTRNSLKSPPAPMLYMPFNGGFGPYFGVVIRTSHPVPSLAKDVSGILERANPTSVVSVASLQDKIADDAAGTRTSLDLLGALACIALLLGVSGIYSVVSYGTERRFHEIGIRMALGARRRDVIALAVKGAVLQGIIGIAAGVVLCAFTTRLMSDSLYRTAPLDPATLVGAAVVMAAFTALAALVPATRAALTPPSLTLRHE